MSEAHISEADVPPAVPPPLLDDEEDEEQGLDSREEEEEEDLSPDDAEVVEETRIIVEKLRHREDGDVTLMDEMAAASQAAKIVKERRAAADREASEKDFGAGLKATMQANLERRKEKAVVIEALKTQGNEALKAGKLEKAVDLYSKALEQCASKKGGSGKQADSWYDGEPALRTNRAQALFKLGRYPDCVDDCNAALENCRKWAKGYLWKARALAKLGNLPKGGACLEAGITLLGKKSKDGGFLVKEFKTLFPKEYDMFCMPVIGRKPESDNTGKPSKAVTKLEPTFDNMENIARKHNTQQQHSGLELPEVQRAMETLEGGEWANNDLQSLIAANPILAKGMADPRSALLLQKLQEDPVNAMKEYGTSPEAREFIMEMMKVLGSHFTKLGETPQKIPQQQEKPQIITEEEAKMQREVDKALSNEEIRKLLEDPETHKVLQQCGNPAMLNKYMHDPVWGVRIRFMIDNGLVKLER